MACAGSGGSRTRHVSYSRVRSLAGAGGDGTLARRARCRRSARDSARKRRRLAGAVRALQAQRACLLARRSWRACAMRASQAQPTRWLARVAVARVRDVRAASAARAMARAVGDARARNVRAAAGAARAKARAGGDGAVKHALQAQQRARLWAPATTA
eukprot:4383328-Pleurochrysis_carterae.AAC.1